MNKSDFDAFNTAVSLNHAVRSRKADPEAVVVWFELLKRYDLSDVQRALQHQALYGKYPAQPSDIAKFIGGTADNGDANPLPPAPKPRIPAPRCTFQISTRRCPDAVSGTGENMGLCDGHAKRRDNIASSAAYLDDRLSAWQPPIGQRQRAEFLFEVHGADAVEREFGEETMNWCFRNRNITEFRYPIAQLRADQLEMRRLSAAGQPAFAMRTL